MTLQIPARHNENLRQLVSRIDGDCELTELYRCVNINAVDRAGMNDHGQVHVQIVANAALRILRLLMEAEIEPSVVTDHKLTREDAEVVVVLAACLHDIGMVVNRDDHERYSVGLGYPKARQLLEGIYAEPTLTTLCAETMHAIIAHQWDEQCLTLEAGAVRVGDALDMTQGRSRIPFEAGQVNIHSVSAMAITEVRITRGEERPVRFVIEMSNEAGIFQVDELLRRKLNHSTLAPHVEVVARMEGEGDERLVKVYRL